jgi:hypothetical protein
MTADDQAARDVQVARDVPAPGDLAARLARHRAHPAAESLYGRCTVCGLTWSEQTLAVQAEAARRGPGGDLAEAERTVRADHREVCRWPHNDEAGHCVGDCEMVCYADGEPWPCANDRVLAEYDRRAEEIVRLKVTAQQHANSTAWAAREAVAHMWKADDLADQVAAVRALADDLDREASRHEIYWSKAALKEAAARIRATLAGATDAPSLSLPPKDRQTSDGSVETPAGGTAAPLPRRDDNVAAWLKQLRDGYPTTDPGWVALDYALDDYRLHADTGTPLDQHACGGPYCCRDVGPIASSPAAGSHD